MEQQLWNQRLAAVDQINQHYQKERTFCFTMDMEWAPEWAIQEALDLFDAYNIPVSVFLTHASERVQEQYGEKDLKRAVGLHPNFLPGSSHGEDPADVIDHLQHLWPAAVSFRSHAYYDSFRITDDFVRRGFHFDANLCLFLQSAGPLLHESGLIRFPVFWEEDIHWNKGYVFDFNQFGMEAYLEGPGLKVFNVQPLTIVLNTPTQEHYFKHKYLFRKTDLDESVESCRHKGFGVRIFLSSLLEYACKNKIRCVFLHEVYDEFFESNTNKGITDASQRRR